MTIGQKIAAGFGVAALTVLAVGLLAYRNAAEVIEVNEQIRQSNKAAAALREVLRLTVDAETGQRGYLLTNDPDYLKPYTAARDAVGPALQQAREAAARRGWSAQADQFAAAVSEKLEELRRTVDANRDKGQAEALAIVKAGRGRQLMDRVRELTDQTLRDEESAVSARRDEADTDARRLLYTGLVGAPLAALAVAGVGLVVTRSATGSVREAVTRLTSTAAEMLATTTEQAAGAQQQAAAVAETVATVDEVTQSAEQAAQRARGVGEAVQRALENGRSGQRSLDEASSALNSARELVEQTAENILALAEQAQAIGEIIATVNDIAEQTNLLALNAAIEASRAGEHGRGFAVVAGEVKALADQSKKATAQVRQILGEIQKATGAAVNSAEQVTRGVEDAVGMSVEAGATIASLAETLADTARAATQIVASAGQQSTGVSQIHQAMRNIDGVSKQNLSALRQTEQAARDLNGLGVELQRLVGK